MQSSSRPSYLPWVDLTRIVSIFFVITVHVSYRIMNEWGRIPYDWWWVGNVAEGISRTAVSLFIMISGYLNFSHPLPMKEYFQRRIPRVLLLLVVWSIIHILLLISTGQEQYDLASAVKAILMGNVYAHLWFLYALFGFYLITPIFQKIVETDRKLIWYFLILWVIFEPLAFLVERFGNLEFGVILPQATGYFGYYLLGYLLATHEFTKKQAWLGFGAYALASLFIIFTTWAMTAASGGPEADTTFYDINGFPVLIGAVGLFIVLKSFKVDSPIIRFFGQTTTGIYLMHYIVLEVVKRGVGNWRLTAFLPINPYFGVPLSTIGIFLISAAITWIFLKIPVLKKIVS